MKSYKFLIYNFIKVVTAYLVKFKMNKLDQTTEEHDILHDICLRIYYARIAMREDLVIKGLSEIDNYFREPNLN
jgi:hypothetical protein